MQQELLNNIHPVFGNAPGAGANDNTAITSGIVDTAGYESLTFLIITGTLADADATFAASMQASDNADLSSPWNVTDADTPEALVGSLAAASFNYAADNKVFKVGYRGHSRYAELTITPANNASAAPIVILPLLGHPRTLPTPNPPQ